MRRRIRLLSPLLLLLGCSNRFTAVESWKTAPELRVFAVLGGSATQVGVLTGRSPFQLPLSDAFDQKQTLSVWVFSYSAATLVARFPGLRGMSPEEIAAALNPGLDPSAGTAAPAADEVLSTQLSSSSPQEITYTDSTWSDWQTAAAATPLRFTLSPDILCRGITVTKIDGPLDRPIQTAALISDQLALLLGGISSATVALPLLRLWTLDPKGELTALPDTLGSDELSDLSWDPSTNSGWGTTHRGGIVHFDQAGHALNVPPAAFQATGISAGRDGTVMARAFFLYERTMTGWHYRDELRVGAALGVEQLRVVTQDRVVLFTDCWVNELNNTDPMRPSWIKRQYDPQCDTTTARPGLFLNLAADEVGMIVVGKGGYVVIRDPASTQWATATPPIGRPDLLTAAAVGNGRHLIAGQGGALAAWLPPEWCVPSSGTTDDIRFAAASASGRTAILLAPGARSTTILRVSMPEP